LEVVHISANGHTTTTCSAWDEWYPADADSIPAAAFHVKAGNTIQVTVETGGAGATEATFIFDNETTGKTFETTLSAPHGTSLQGNSAEVVVETPEWISGGSVSQPLLSDFVKSPVIYDVPGSDGYYVQEAYGAIDPASDSVAVTEDHYWTAAALHNAALLI
jgi:hypothetical protein